MVWRGAAISGHVQWTSWARWSIWQAGWIDPPRDPRARGGHIRRMADPAGFEPASQAPKAFRISKLPHGSRGQDERS